ncbi:MAG: type II toxin-antitoxin system RelE family toxin [Thermoplasmata archaeon]
MPRVTFSPEGFRSLGHLPTPIRHRFNQAFALLEEAGPDTALLDTHRLSGAPDLWTLRIAGYRGIYQWRVDEARFMRFGHRAQVYHRLPK